MVRTLPKLLLLGIDTPIGLTVLRELGRHGVPVHGVARRSGALGTRSRHIAEHSVRPDPPERLCAWLPRRAADAGAQAIMAIGENDLVQLDSDRDAFAPLRLVLPDGPALRTVLDKAATLAAARELGIDVPATFGFASLEEVAGLAGELPYPLVLKWANPPAVASGLATLGIPLVKAEFCETPEQLLQSLARYAPLGQFPLAQQYCAGHGIGQMFLMKDGEALLRFQHERMHEWPPEGGVSTLCRSLPLTRHAALMARSETLLRAIGWEGPAMVEYRYDPASGRAVLMEINGRFWGSLPLASACGVEFGWGAYCAFVLGEPPAQPRDYPDLRCRYMNPETQRLFRVLFRPGKIVDPRFERAPLRDLLDYVGRFFDPRSRYYVWQLDDPLPCLFDLADTLRSLITRT